MVHKFSTETKECVSSDTAKDIWFVYFKKNKPIAYVCGEPWYGDFFKITSLFVSKKYRHRGIGGKLRMHLIEYVKSNTECSKIITLSKSNSTIYHSIGFTKSKIKSENGYAVYELEINQPYTQPHNDSKPFLQ